MYQELYVSKINNLSIKLNKNTRLKNRKQNLIINEMWNKIRIFHNQVDARKRYLYSEQQWFVYTSSF